MINNQNNNEFNGIWFFGLSGSGKTTSSIYLKRNIYKSALLIDGDDVRKFISYDLGYNIEDRKIQISRILGLCKLCVKSKIFPICSTVYMDKYFINEINKIKIKIIKIERNFQDLKNLKIYQLKENVIGIDKHYEDKLKVKIIKNKIKEDLYENLLKEFG
tara:strand:+ start:291 stop:770 length:480 start_codon:yes stop_codon:yes gene_type:complete